MTEPKPGGQRYSLRESSKLTPRYREYIGGDEVGTTAAAAQSQQQGQAVQEHKLRSVKSEIKSTEKPTPKQKQRQQQQKRTSDSTAAEIQETSSFKRHLITGGGPCSGPLISRGRTAIARHGIPGKDPPFSKRTHQPNEGTQKVVVEEEEEEVNQPTEDEEMQEDEGEEQEEDTFDDDFPIGAEQEVSTSGYIKEETGQGQFLKQISTGGIKIRGPKDYAVQSVHPLNRRFSVQAADLSDELKTNLRKLKNVLKLPKARRFVLCEFFYSGVDQQIFLAENEFLQLMRESFPNLKCIKLRKQEWREIRRLIGKPRRCSQAFLDEERSSLEDKRQKIRDIYNGTCTSLTEELSELPANLPRPPVVGQKIYARVRFPKDGIYAATVDAVTDDGYRLLFDDENIPTCVSKDYEVMFDQPAELLSINYFIEQNRTNRRSDANKTATAQFGHHLLYPASGNGFLTAPTPVIDATGKMVSVQTYMGQQQAEASANMGLNSKISIAKDEKVGNFPVRMLVILVKLCKVIEYKKQLIAQLTMMNDTLEKMNMLGNEYPEELKVQFSQIVLDLETVNRLFRNYLAALQTHYNTLLPHLSEPQPTDRPELLRRTCNTHAFQIVKHCNTELNVRDKRILHLITSLTSIMLQLRTIGLSKKKFNISDMNLLSESLKQIRTQIVPNNSATFQDFVEVHMKQMLRMMLNK